MPAGASEGFVSTHWTREKSQQRRPTNPKSPRGWEWSTWALWRAWSVRGGGGDAGGGGPWWRPFRPAWSPWLFTGVVTLGCAPLVAATTAAAASSGQQHVPFLSRGVQVITRPAAQRAQRHHQGVLYLWRAAERSERGLEKGLRGCRSSAVLSSSLEGHAAETHTPTSSNRLLWQILRAESQNLMMFVIHDIFVEEFSILGLCNHVG